MFSAMVLRGEYIQEISKWITCFKTWILLKQTSRKNICNSQCALVIESPGIPQCTETGSIQTSTEDVDNGVGRLEMKYSAYTGLVWDTATVDRYWSRIYVVHLTRSILLDWSTFNGSLFPIHQILQCRILLWRGWTQNQCFPCSKWAFYLPDDLIQVCSSRKYWKLASYDIVQVWGR